VARRAKSYSDFYRVARAQLMKESKKVKEKVEEPMMPAGVAKKGLKLENMYEAHEDQLLDASQEEYRYAPNHNGSAIWVFMLVVESIETS
jgi:conserved oligomeric Golgi complex subunit 3